MKRFGLIFALSLSLSSFWCRPLVAGTNDKPHWYGALEAYDADEIGDAHEDAASEFASSLEGGFTGSTTGRIEITPAIGLRIGFSNPINRWPWLDVGASYGYIDGPKISEEFRANNPIVIGFTDEETNYEFHRFLLETGVSAPITEQFSFRLGVGAGLALAHVSYKTSSGGDLAVTGPSGDSWSGFTAEISPSLVYAFRKVLVEGGARWSSFPKQESDAPHWTPFGYFLKMGVFFEGFRWPGRAGKETAETSEEVAESKAVKEKKSQPGRTKERYNLSQGVPVEIPAKKTALPLVIYGETQGQSSSYVPSGYMGDSIHIKSVANSAPVPSGSGQYSMQITYPARGREGWAGIYWLSPANNWGKIKGAGYDLSRAEKLTFWARGDKGGEFISEFKVGGIVGPFPDTDVARIGPIRLSREWKQYEIKFKRKDMRHIAGGFVFSVKRSDNARGAIFYLDEIVVQGKPEEPIESADSSDEDVEADTGLPAADVAVPAAGDGSGEILDRSIKIVVPFASSEALISEEGVNAMDEMVALAQRYPAGKIFVEGHTDDIGPEETNRALSLERAKSVANYLISHGVEASRVAAQGLGEDQPLSPESNQTPEGRARNRRVEMVIMP